MASSRLDEMALVVLVALQDVSAEEPDGTRRVVLALLSYLTGRDLSVAEAEGICPGDLAWRE